MDTEKLKQTVQAEIEKDEKLSIGILTIVMAVAELFLFIYQNCYAMKGMVKRSAKKKGFLYRKFLKNNVYPKLENSDLSEEQKELAIEKIRQMIIEDKLDEFIP
jgi:hypothetical protein